MAYQSPLHFFSQLNLPINNAQLDKEHLALARKMLLAEIDLSDTQTLKKGNVELTKNDILNLFEDLKNSENLTYHTAVFADKVLLKFLEEFKIEDNPQQVSDYDRYAANAVSRTRFANNPVYNESAFVEFIGVYFKDAFQIILQRAIEKQDRNTVKLVMQNPRFMLYNQEFDAFSRILLQLQGKEEDADGLQYRIENRQNYTQEEVIAISNPNFIDCLNFLPDFFENFRDIYAISLINIGVVLYNKKKYALTKSVISNAQQLNVSTYYREKLDKYYADLVENAPASGSVSSSSDGSSSSSSGMSWTTILVLIGLGLRLIIFAGDCSKPSNSSDYSTNYPAITVDALYTGNRIDSAFQWVANQFKYVSLYELPNQDFNKISFMTREEIGKKYKKQIQTPKNGAFMYKEIFEKLMFQAPSNSMDTTVINIFNDTDDEAIVMINTSTPYSVSNIASYAKYIAPHKTVAFDMMQLYNNRIYFYVGRHFNPNITFKKDSENDWGNFGFTLKGGFMKPNGQSLQFMAHPLDVALLYLHKEQHGDTFRIHTTTDKDFLHVELPTEAIKIPRNGRTDGSYCDELYGKTQKYQ